MCDPKNRSSHRHDKSCFPCKFHRNVNVLMITAGGMTKDASELLISIDEPRLFRHCWFLEVIGSARNHYSEGCEPVARPSSSLLIFRVMPAGASFLRPRLRRSTCTHHVREDRKWARGIRLEISPRLLLVLERSSLPLTHPHTLSSFSRGSPTAISDWVFLSPFLQPQSTRSVEAITI